MAIIIRDTDQTSGDTISNGDDYILREGVLVSDQNGDALVLQGTGTDNFAIIEGGLVGDSDGLVIATTDVSVTIRSTGFVAGKLDGLQIGDDGDSATISNAGTIHGDNRGVRMTAGADDVDIQNAGQITADNIGIDVLGTNARVTNTATGTVLGAANAIALAQAGAIITNAGTLSSGGDVLASASGGHTITNTGLMTGGAGGIDIDAGENAITNAGTISSTDTAISITAGNNEVRNDGVIHSTTNDGIFLFSGSASETTIVINTGQITAGKVGIETQASFVNSLGAVTIANSGDIAAPEAGMFLSDSSRVTNTGSITGNSFGIIGDTGVEIVNSGEITGGTTAGDNAILIRAGFDTDVDTSLIVNTATGTIVGGTAAAIRFSDVNDVVLINHGMIVGGGSSFDNAIEFDSGELSPLRMVNTGSINGSVLAPDGDDRINNSGLIEGNVDLSLGADRFVGFGGTVTGTLDAGGGNDTIFVDQNDAVIDGGADFDVVFARGDVLDVTNVEEIRLQGDGGFEVQGGAQGEVINGNLGGNLLAGNGGEDSINGGAGDDVISGGDQNDTLLGSTGDDEISGDLGEDSIRGGAGDDTLNGGAGGDSVVGDGGNDEINGNFGDDTLNGAFGDDTIDGGGNNDFVLGLFGADLLLGGAGNDTLQGGTQNDTLLGGDGEDILAGGSGDDRIEAGLGRDIVLGGTGNDVFVYNSVAEIDDGVDDRIKDFTVGDDLIDVSNIDEEASFTFIGTAAFTGSGDMEIRYFQNAFGATFLQFDENGDGTSDGQLILLNTPGAVTADDFVL